MAKKSKEKFLEPAASVIKFFGGATAFSRVVNRHPSRVAMLRVSRERGGTGGEIPTSILPLLKAEAEKRGRLASLTAILLEARNEPV